ncbi:uncharacterized protein K02A2.6-like [Homarus americanus]|uniref:uncharacterized protein K02A2.6-like n=1 Tax=Homarus americanus TaxID=6706 RepID=UPI001C452B02|nr:uncharacterized protein K02A2.6-like [Homarus americanus]
MRDFCKIRNSLAVDGGLVLHSGRIVISTTIRRQILARLRDSHRGIEATKHRARQTVWWPGITRDIVNTVQSCDACQTLLPSQVKEPLMCDPILTRPFEDVSADLFSHSGKNYLLYADRLSGWPHVGTYGRDATSRSTIKLLHSFFVNVGVLVHLCTYGGPQFSSLDSRSFLKRWGGNHEIPSPHYPQSNSHVEAYVKVNEAFDHEDHEGWKLR